MSTNPEQDALHARWTLEGRIPLSGVADGAVWRRARSVATHGARRGSPPHSRDDTSRRPGVAASTSGWPSTVVTHCWRTWG